MNNPSKGEQIISQILSKSNIKYSREVIFNDLTGFSGAKLRFDFCIYDSFNNPKFLIEFQGRQHYEWVKYFSKTKSDFLKRQELDRKKISWALAHYYPLYLIPFWDLELLNNLSDLLRPEYLAKDRWHNDKAYRQYLQKNI